MPTCNKQKVGGRVGDNSGSGNFVKKTYNNVYRLYQLFGLSNLTDQFHKIPISSSMIIMICMCMVNIIPADVLATGCL